MALVLQVIGFLCVTAVVLGFIGFLLVRFKLKQLFKGLEGIEVDENLTPARLHLHRSAQPEWKDPTESARLISDFQALGFADIGSFTTQEIAGLRLQALVKPDTNVYGVIYEHDRAGIWIDFVTRYADGTSLTYSTARQGGELDQRPGHGCVRDPSATPAALYQRLLEERPERPFSPATAEGFVAEFEKAYADSMDWRNARGGPTEEEIRAIAAASGDEISPEMLHRVREMKRMEAMSGLREALQERFLREGGLSAAEWEEVRDRLIFVHDQLTQSEAGELFDQALGDEEVSDTRPSEAVGATAREFFAALAELAPATKEFRKLGVISDPLEADVYAGPAWDYRYDEDDDA